MFLLVNDLPTSRISTFAKFGICAHSLEIEEGRHKKDFSLCKKSVDKGIDFCYIVSHYQNIEITIFKELEENNSHI